GGSCRSGRGGPARAGAGKVGTGRVPSAGAPLAVPVAGRSLVRAAAWRRRAARTAGPARPSWPLAGHALAGLGGVAQVAERTSMARTRGLAERLPVLRRGGSARRHGLALAAR